MRYGAEMWGLQFRGRESAEESGFRQRWSDGWLHSTFEFRVHGNPSQPPQGGEGTLKNACDIFKGDFEGTSPHSGKQQGEFSCLVKVLSIQHRDTAEAGHPEMWCAFAAPSWQKKAGPCNPPQRPFCVLKQNTRGQTGRWPQLLHHFARNCNGAVDVCLSVCQ